MIGTALATAPRWRSGAASDRGPVRAMNQDAYLDRPDVGLWVVADGMGGHRDGARASRAIVEALALLPRARLLGAGVRAIQLVLTAVNAQLLAETDGPDDLIGSTVVALLAAGGSAALVWAGDSRAYRLRGGRLTQRTTDHSQVQALVDAGVLDADLAEAHPLANVLLRAVGSDPVLRLDARIERLVPGDRLLLCSDGLYREIGPAELAARLAAGHPAETAQALVDAACAHGGRDNVTAVVVEVAHATPVTGR